METRRSLLRRLKLRTILVVALLLSGIIPLAPGNVQPEAKTAMDTVFNEARRSKGPTYGFVQTAAVRKPLAILAVPVPGGAAGPKLIVEAQLRFVPLEKLTKEESSKGVEVLLL